MCIRDRYSLLDMHGADADTYILVAIIAHFAGLFTCGLFIKSQAAAKNMMLAGMGLCLSLIHICQKNIDQKDELQKRLSYFSMISQLICVFQGFHKFHLVGIIFVYFSILRL